MQTLFTILILLVIGFIVSGLLSTFVLNIAGILGALVSGKDTGKRRFKFGIAVSVIGQLFVYLAYTAFVIGWSKSRIEIGHTGLFIWLIAFLVVVVPIWLCSVRARHEARTDHYTNAQVEALPLTLFLVIVFFFLFIFVPSIMSTIYGWVPYV